VQKEDGEPDVTVVVAAHNEDDSIERRVENLLSLDYPPDRVRVVVASDASTDRTDELVEAIAAREPRVRLLRCARGGKVAAQHRAVRETDGEIVAFSDANAAWEPDALRKLVRSFADPDVGYVCGQLKLRADDGRNREGLYWRYEVWLRAQEAAIHSLTGGYGSIYAVRRSDYVEDDPRFGHDLGFPYLMVQRGRRAVYEPEAVSVESAAAEPEDEFGRKVRMMAQSWGHILSGRMLRPTDPLYMAELVSHRLLRYSSGLLHLALFGASVRVSGEGRVYRLALAAQLAGAGLALAGKLRLPVPGARVAYYYALVTAATVAGLVEYLRAGTPVVWEKAAGTR
jgi:glycosyltransferase involved in cell wall biosynthesis